jgi:hypothetical protein
VVGAGGDTLTGRGVIPRAAAGFCAAALPLARAAGAAPDALLRFDVRALEADELANHPEAPPPDWDEGACLAFATRLGRALAAALVDHLPTALAPRSE